MCQLLPIQRPWWGALALQILPFAFLAWMIRSRMMNKASYRERERERDNGENETEERERYERKNGY